MKLILYSSLDNAIVRLQESGITADVDIIIDKDVLSKKFNLSSEAGTHILLINNEAELDSITDFKYDDYISLSVNNTVLTKKISNYLKPAKSSLIKSNEYLQLIEQFGDSFLLLDTEGYIIEANSGFCEITNYSLKELLKKNITELFPSSEFEIKFQI